MSIIKTFIFDPIESVALDYAKKHLDIVDWTDKGINNYSQAEAVIIRTFKMTKEVIDKMPELKIIAKHGVGLDNIDLDYAKSKGIKVTNTPLANINSVAELVVALALNCAKKINLSHQLVTQGISKIAPFELTGFEIQNKTVGLVGLGRIGTLVGKKLKNGFDMKVGVYDPYTSKQKCEEEGFIKYEQLNDLIKASQVISISVPLTKDTENLISHKEFSLMEPNTIVINTSRGKVVDENALYESLNQEKIFGAALDVFAEEPVSKDHPLFTCNNFIGTPHNGANTKEALIRMGTGAVDEIINISSNN
ncbi:hydroxyacid dehydrogenase [Sinobaca sp. H24]|uniref:hydroxyacid dehydrogenase n=1 Tax=Sinobaca sp. H24 TaxID=2923376 RepID=UPI00207A2B35|nr:hydroxyacid dehydrogenase [Sinobaca sp. H24]